MKVRPLHQMFHSTPTPRGYRLNFVSLSVSPCIHRYISGIIDQRMADQSGHVHEALDSLCDRGRQRGAVVFRHHVCPSVAPPFSPRSQVHSFLFSQSGMGNHDTFIHAESWSTCKWEAETGRLVPFSGHPGLHSKTHFQDILAYFCPKQTNKQKGM